MPENNLAKSMKSLAELEVPRGLRQRIMRRVSFLRLRIPILGLLMLLVANTAITIWRVEMKFVENDALYLIKTLFADFEWDFSYAAYVFSELGTLIPLSLLISFVINLFIPWYGYLVFRSIKKIKY